MARPANTEERRTQIALALRTVMAARGYEGATVGEIAREAGLAPGLVHYYFDDKQEILRHLLTLLESRLRERAEVFTRRATGEKGGKGGKGAEGGAGEAGGPDEPDEPDEPGITSVAKAAEVVKGKGTTKTGALVMDGVKSSRVRLAALTDSLLERGPGEDAAAVACWVAAGAESLREPRVREVYERVLTGLLASLEARVRDVLVDEGRRASDAPSVASAILAAVQGYFVLAVAAPDVIPHGSAAMSVRHMTRGLLDVVPMKSLTHG